MKIKKKFTSCFIVYVLYQINNITNCFTKNDLTIDRNVCFYDSLSDFVITFMRMNINVDSFILSNI